MTERDKIISELFAIANELTKNWTREKENNLWDIASDYNRDHNHENEIFVYEDWIDNDTKKIYVEDDYFLIQF